MFYNELPKLKGVITGVFFFYSEIRSDKFKVKRSFQSTYARSVFLIIRRFLG